MTQPPVALALDTLAIPYRLFHHAGPVQSLEQAASERGQQPEQIVRSLLFRVDGEQYVMALVAGGDQVAWPELRRYLGVSRVTMATEEQVLAVTGYTRGAVAPFGLPKPLRILVDDSVLAQQELSLGSGVRGIAVLMQRADLLAALAQVTRDAVEIVSLTANHDAAGENNG